MPTQTANITEMSLPAQSSSQTPQSSMPQGSSHLSGPPTQTQPPSQTPQISTQPSIGEIFGKRATDVHRLLSRRDKDGGTHRRGKSKDKSADKKTRPLSGESNNGLSFLGGLLKKSDKDKDKEKGEKGNDQDQENKFHVIKERLKKHNYGAVSDDQIRYVLEKDFANGNVDEAVELLIIFHESDKGVVYRPDPAIPLLGACNRDLVTCYLDSLFFAMFARMDNYEILLYSGHIAGEKQRHLSSMIRLWVNMLRKGKLIPDELTKPLQEAIAACGWEEAAMKQQQDSSEAYSFITETLQLQLLKLRVDVYHEGAEPDPDDHKTVMERLLEVAVPDPPKDGQSVTLEDCLGNYFNNKIDVRRKIDEPLRRTNTMSSVASDSTPFSEKEGEIPELSRSLPSSPVSVEPQIPPAVRKRAESFIREVLVERMERAASLGSTDRPRRNSMRKGRTMRKEVSIPAWQFFNLIPWVTARTAQSPDSRIPDHLGTNPAIAITLKRYGMSEAGKPIRKNTVIDIPTDLRLPHFVDDDSIPEDGPMIRNFKLSLQSGTCHRGNSVNEGHYIAFARETAEIPDGDIHSSRMQSDSSNPPDYSAEKWLVHDDLASPRVVVIDEIQELFKKEMPYQLFYRIEPIYEMSSALTDPQPPSYEVGHQPDYSEDTLTQQSYFDGAQDMSTPAIQLSAVVLPPTPGQSIHLPEDRRGSVALTSAGSSINGGPIIISTSAPDHSIDFPEGRRGSVAFTEPLTSAGSSINGVPAVIASSAPGTPGEETAAQRMSRAAKVVLTKSSKSRPTSQSGEGRVSGAFSRLNLMLSKDSSKVSESSKDHAPSASTDVTPRTSITIEEGALRPHGEVGIDRSKSKRGKKKRDKSQGPSSDKSENDEHHGHHHSHHSHKGKGKAKDVPDRECMVM